MSIDVGTGDGRLPFAWAREAPERLFIGLDANAAGLREFSARAVREHLANLLYVRASVESMPPELAGTADRMTVVLPWGSLLRAVTLPSVEALRHLRAACQPGASFTVVVGSDPSRDEAELRRLGLPPLAVGELGGRLHEGYRQAGWTVPGVRTIGAADVAGWPSTWTRRLSHGRGRAFVRIDARAV